MCVWRGGGGSLSASFEVDFLEFQLFSNNANLILMLLKFGR